MSGTIRRQFKVCLVGDGYVGKTSVRRMYLKEGFKRSYIPTLGVDFAQKSLLFEGNPTNLVIWDIAGQVAFQNLRRRYYEGSSGIILVYAVDDRRSFDNASKWLVEAHGFMDRLPPLMIVANKIDLRETLRQGDVISTEEGQAFANSISEKLGTQAVFIETSAKTGKNIDETFEALVRMMINVDHAPVSSFPKSYGMASSEPESKPPVTGEAITSTASTTAPASPTPQTPVTAQPSITNESVEVDSVTLLPSDSEYLEEESIGQAMVELQTLRAKLKTAEEELANELSRFETELLTLKNTVHVKRIMFEHLKQQLKMTREEWASAYDQYQDIEKQRKELFADRNRQIEQLRQQIIQVGVKVRTRISDLDMKKLSE